MTADRARTSAASATWTNAEPDTLMERVLAPANLKRAYQRVVSNKGAPGDRYAMEVKRLMNVLDSHMPSTLFALVRTRRHKEHPE